MKKKILSTGLIILLVFMSFVLTGCGDDNDEGTNESSKIENSSVVSNVLGNNVEKNVDNAHKGDHYP